MMTFNYLHISGKVDFNTKSLDALQLIRDELVAAGFDMEEEELVVKKIDGRTYPLFQGIGTLASKSSDFDGRYYLKGLVAPNPYGDAHVMIYMLVRDDQGISHYQDFADRVDVSTLWKTFRYLE